MAVCLLMEVAENYLVESALLVDVKINFQLVLQMEVEEKSMELTVLVLLAVVDNLVEVDDNLRMLDKSIHLMAKEECCLDAFVDFSCDHFHYVINKPYLNVFEMDLVQEVEVYLVMVELFLVDLSLLDEKIVIFK